MVFCHQLVALGLLGLLHTYHSALPLSNVSGSDLQAAVPPAAFSGLQLILFFASLQHGEPLVVVPSITLAGALLPAAMPLQARLDGGFPKFRWKHFTRLQFVRSSPTTFSLSFFSLAPSHSPFLYIYHSSGN